MAKNNSIFSGEKKIISFEGYDFNYAYFIRSQKN